MAGHKDRHRLRTHQICIELDIGRKDRRNLILDGALQLCVAEAAYCDGTDLRYKDVTLLIHNKDIVIGKGPPDTEHDTVARRNDILGLQPLVIGVGKISPEEIGSIGFQPCHQRRGVGGLRPGWRRLQGRRLTLGRAIGWRCAVHDAAGRLIGLRIETIGILHSGTCSLDARGSGNRIADTASRDRRFRAVGAAVGNAAHQGLAPDSIIGGSLAARTAEKNSQ